MAANEAQSTSAETADAFLVEIESFRARNAQRSLPDYELSTETHFTPRSRSDYRNTGEIAVHRSSDENPVLVELVEQLTAQTNHGILDSMRHADSQPASASDNASSLARVVDAEIQTSRISAIVCLVVAAIAVIFSLFAFIAASTNAADGTTIATTIISLVALFSIASVALWVNLRSRKTLQLLLHD